VRFDYCLGHRQTETDPRTISPGSILPPVKPVEDMCQILGAEPWPIVPDIDLKTIDSLAKRQVDARSTIAMCVVEKDHQHLAQAVGVGPRFGRVRW
jgi:hypothetical protein